MTLARAIGVLIACALALTIMRTAYQQRRNGAPWAVYVSGYAAALVWAVAAYVTAIDGGR